MGEEEGEGGISSQMELQMEVMGGGKVICDGLLCSILHAMSHSANKDDFISVIERACDEEEILSARKKLFICDKQKKPVLGISRGSLRKNIEDIVEQMLKIDKEAKSNIFFMPWDYVIQSFDSDTENRAKLIEQELCTEIDVKIDTLKNEMVLKNQAIIELINSKFNEVISHVSGSRGANGSSYANITASNVSVRQPGAPAGSQGGPSGVGGAEGGGAVHVGGQAGSSWGPAAHVGGQTGRSGGQGAHVGGPAVHAVSQGGQGGPGAAPSFNFPPVQDSRSRGMGGNSGGIDRSRSGSKRRRGEDGTWVIDSDSRAQGQTKQKKFFVGTSNNAGRKMRSPPVDIFVYGVHPDTSIDDIVEDLACSDIIIRPEDISKKSRDEAFLKSYKISVKAEDLQKALDPSVWPMRVKVREFIYYSRKPGTGQGQGRGAPQQGQGVGGQGQAHAGQVHPSQEEVRHKGQHQGDNQVQDLASARGAPGQFLAPNRYALPGDEVPGGVRPDV